jgi:hypothetical protein
MMTRTMLKAMKLAYPNVGPMHNALSFDPFDPTKGDLAALNEALERDGWRFYYLSASLSFAAVNEEFECTLYAPTPADRALKCVEAMP